MKPQHRFLSCFSIVLPLLLLIYTFQTSAAQRQPRYIDQEYSLNYPAWAPTSPVEVIDLKVNGRPLSLKTKFYDDGEWIKGLSWKIKNNSNQAILRLYLEVTFPETRKAGPMWVFAIPFGVDPKLPDAKGEARRIEPNATAEFMISDKMYENIKKAIERIMPLSEVSHLRLSMPFILFEDDSGWSNGQWMRRDPTDPMKWKDIE